MDANRFDVWIQSKTPAASRRAALGGVLGATLTAILARFSGEDAAAKRKRKKRKKKKNQQQCPGATPTTCGAACVNTRSDPGHCGDCDQACATGDLCRGGACFVPCAAATSPCGLPPACPGGGSCVNAGGDAVCADITICEPHGVESCDGDPCPVGRACIKLCCGAAAFFCALPA